MAKKLSWKYSSLLRAASGELLPGLTSVMFISAIVIVLLNGYNDHHYQLREISNNEMLAEEALNSSSQTDKIMILLEKSAYSLFKYQHQQPMLTNTAEYNQRYALSANELTEAFYLSCPSAKLSARVSGLLSGDNINKNVAVIHYQGKEESYGINDSIGEGVTLIRIFPDRVIVNEHGYCAALLMN
ncbi:hypothetical protein M1D48_18770 [Erwinia sp. D4-22]